MVNINTKNGQYNITDSLMEAIKENNPGIILNEFHIDSDGNRYNDDGTPYVSDGNTALDDNLSEEERNKYLAQQKADLSIVLKQYMEHGDFITRNIKITNDNGEKISFTKFRKTHPEFNKVFKELKNDNTIRQKALATKEWESPINDNDLNKTLENLVNNVALKQQIDGIETLSASVANRCKKNIQQTVGLMGTAVLGQKSNYTGQQDAANQNAQNPNNPGNQNTPDEFHNTEQPMYNVTGNDAVNNNNNSGNKKYGNDKNIKSNAQLLGGGFRIAPLFNSMDDKLNSGKAIKYYKANIVSSEKTLIDDMINVLIKLNSTDENDVDRTNALKFKNMAYNFLRNTVYKVEVNNDKLYNNVFRAMRYDDVLVDKFEIANTSSVQMFDTKEQIIAFKEKNNKVPVAIFIIVPMFAKGMELINKFKGLGKHFKGMKG